MKQTLILLFFFVFQNVNGQNFKDIKPNLTDSTKVIKTEIKPELGFERIYYIDYAIASNEKKVLMEIDENAESIKSTYWGIIKNLKTKPQKINLNLPEKWFKLFKYKGNWVLFNDLPKFLLTDSSLVTFDMDDPISAVITKYKSFKNRRIINSECYNWENPSLNHTSCLDIKIIDPKRLITLWKFDDSIYYLMVPESQISKFPIMVMKENALMDDENDIFDKIDYQDLWGKE